LSIPVLSVFSLNLKEKEMFFIIIFISPLYLAIRGKWGAFIINLALYIMAFLTILLFGLGIIFWALGVYHAWWHHRKFEATEQAQKIAAEMVKAQAKASAPVE
jgi:fatty-acid desaturase